MTYAIRQVQPPLEFIPPRYTPWVHQVAKAVAPTYLRWRGGIAQIEHANTVTLAELYQQFQEGKVRLVLAFRHPSVQDPPCLMYYLSHLMPQVAAQAGIRLRPPVHAHFLYDRGIPLWAGPGVGWLFSRLGGTPIQRGGLDRAGLRSARELFIDGRMPLVAAPEGATNGHNELVSPLEPGVAHMAFWCQEDLLKAGRSEQVLIVPIGIQYRLIGEPWHALEKLLQDLEAEGGVKVPPNLPPGPDGLYRRLFGLSEHLLTVMEGFYERFYHIDRPEVSADLDPNQALGIRLKALLDGALQVSEQFFQLKPQGTVIERCRRIEQAGWDRIYRDDLKALEAISPLERGLADRIAEESSLRMWHMRLVESFVAVTGHYLLEKLTVDRFADSLMLVRDLTYRIKGKSPFTRPVIAPKQARITVGSPLAIAERWEAYQQSRRSARQAVADLTQDLQAALEALIQ